MTTSTHPMCFHSDESFYNPETGKYKLIRVDRDEAGYVVMGEMDTVEQAQQAAKLRNLHLGVSDEEALEIRLSSMSQHHIEHPPSPFPMPFDEFMTRLLAVLPDAQVGEDNDGQMIVYTGLAHSGDDVVVMES